MSSLPPPPPKVTLSGQPPAEGHGPTDPTPAPGPIDPATGMHTDYWVLPEEERRKGFVRPVQRTYVHTTCGARTTIGTALAETYARQPGFYGATFCVACKGHFPVGKDGEFTWDGRAEKVGT